MNNFKFEYIAETDRYSINGELWRRAEPVAVEEVKKPYFPKPEFGESYCYIGANGKIMRTLWTDDNIDEYRYHTLNCWLDKSEAEAYVARYGKYLPDRLTLAIRRWKIANGIEDSLKWGSIYGMHYMIYYDPEKKWESYFHSSTWQLPNVEYFRDPDTAQKCLTDLHEYFDNAIEMAIQLTEWNAMSNSGAESEGE